MKKLIILAPLLLWGCVNLTPIQQQNLQLQLKVGETYLQVAGNLYCIYEPTIAKLIAVYDSSTKTRTAIDKANAAQALLCEGR